MKMIKLMFENTEFYSNPETLKISSEKRMNKSIELGEFEHYFEASNGAKIIEGEGEFFGKDAVWQVLRLEKLQQRKGDGELFIPEFSPLRAFFKNLSYEISADKGSVKYSFVFIQSKPDSKSLYDFGFTYALSGENLFHIANRTGVAIEKIVELNDFSDPFSVNEGEKVMLK